MYMSKLKNALKKALDFEKKGHRIYMNCAKKTKNPLVKDVFEYLAAQEKLHIKDIERFIEKKEIITEGDLLNSTKAFFGMTVRRFEEKIYISKDDIAAYENALELEKESYNYYKVEYENIEDEDAMKFFRFMMDQESAHYLLIEKAYSYLKDPFGFNVEQEEWIMEG